MNSKEFKEKALAWADGFPVCCILDSNSYGSDRFSRYEFLVAAGASAALSVPSGNAFQALQEFRDARPGWLFGFFSYDLKNETEDLTSSHPDPLGFPDLYFFSPQYLVGWRNGQPEVLAGPAGLIDTIRNAPAPLPNTAAVTMSSRLSRAAYLDRVDQLRSSIMAGDIYELNFCQEFFSSEAEINPPSVFQALNTHSPTPFAAYFKLGSRYALCASPERFLCKRGNRLVSQPIKGTAARHAEASQDLAAAERLRHDSKEQAENVMIVDLVRNDLTKSARRGSVQVEELFGIYPFRQVYQMISTVSCEIDPALHPVAAIRHTFPMGSMTGAPKIRAMQLIEEQEVSRRGLYSGAIGYFDPQGDFDFNVVIRSILYNAESKYLSFQVGSAITFAANAGSEYEECLLKASAMAAILNSPLPARG
ncbi:aminodeoxychorismate synthase component I [Pedobacter yulinensis]|uniref:Aminodeoxychorismate synthase component I n=1 Tax=Pedobacter yulinensis TaxID=2126353 RepID=A0A2T3HIH8_9SPHI|nr:anthranilate synthase component I family protein [Pedobacter yulinensis]PST82213.1 aminodeoxychorismate synthase component I [Pedobacter yulinensis]